jgi:pyruvate dehydrogenase E1 component alpha subunit
MPGRRVDGTDFFAVQEVAREAIERARAGEGPTLIHAKCLRLYGHFEGDMATYRPAGEVERQRRERDCLPIFRKRVTEAALLETSQLDAIDRSVASLIDQSVVDARAAPRPTVADLTTDVYLSY